MTILTDSPAIQNIVRGDDRERRRLMAQTAVFESDPVTADGCASWYEYVAEKEATDGCNGRTRKPLSEMTDEEINRVLFG